MTNKHILLVKRWLADNDSVSKKELSYSNASAMLGYSDAAAAADAAFDAFNAAEAAAEAANVVMYATEAASEGNGDAGYWVKRYEELTK